MMIIVIIIVIIVMIIIIVIIIIIIIIINQDLGSELQKIQNVKVKIVPLVVGSLGAIPKEFGSTLKEISITAGTAQIQKTVLLGMARILRKVLEI